MAGVVVVILLGAAVIVGQQPVASPGEPSNSPAATQQGPPDATSTATELTPPSPDPTELTLAYTCGGHAFSPELFEQPETDLRSTPAGTALAEFLASGFDEERFLPNRGWRLTGIDATSASFVAPVRGDPPYADARLELGADGWEVIGWGQCRPTVAVEGLNAASWRVARGETIGPATTSFVAAVTERTCTGGSSSEGRVRDPLITYDTQRVVIIFTVDPLPAGTYTCPSNPATKVTVELAEPLGDRQLLDGGEYPWADATEPDPLQG